MEKLEYLENRQWVSHGCNKLKDLGYCLPYINCRYKTLDDDLEALGIVNGRGE